MFRSFFALLVIVCMVVFSMPAFAGNDSGRDGPAIYSQTIQIDTNDLVCFTSGDAIPAPVESVNAYHVSVAIVGYDTGDEKTSALAIKDELKSQYTYMIKPGNQTAYRHFDPGRTSTLQTA